MLNTNSSFLRFQSILFICTNFILLTGCQSTGLTTDNAILNKKAWVESCEDWDLWDKPGPAFQIHGNSYYVGTCGISAILITSDSGHVLIDSGTEAGAKVVAANIKSLGFSLSDIKLLLHSHEHFDHVGGMAFLQQLSGAKLLTSSKAEPVISTGIASDDDPQKTVLKPFLAAEVGGTVAHAEAIVLGDIELTPFATPGHTPGALSWQWQSCENKICLDIVYADSLSPVSSDSYRFSDHPEYVKAYRSSLEALSQLDCDIILAPHPSASQMRDRLSSQEGLIDSMGCKIYAQGVLNRLHQRLLKESS